MNCLLCLGQLMDHMDKWFVLDEILPFLHKIPTREPAVLMSMLGENSLKLEKTSESHAVCLLVKFINTFVTVLLMVLC